MWSGDSFKSSSKICANNRVQNLHPIIRNEIHYFKTQYSEKQWFSFIIEWFHSIKHKCFEPEKQIGWVKKSQCATFSWNPTRRVPREGGASFACKFRRQLNRLDLFPPFITLFLNSNLSILRFTLIKLFARAKFVLFFPQQSTPMKNVKGTNFPCILAFCLILFSFFIFSLYQKKQQREIFVESWIATKSTYRHWRTT